MTRYDFEAHRAGELAFQSGALESANPYAKLARDWTRGYRKQRGIARNRESLTARRRARKQAGAEMR